VSQRNIPHEYFANISSVIRNFFSKFYKLIIYPYLHLNSIVLSAVESHVKHSIELNSYWISIPDSSVM